MNIILNNVKFYYSDPYVPVFGNMSLTIDTKWKAGLVGRNGAGKTTLLKLITGELLPVCGSIHVPVSIRRFPYQIGDENKKVKNIIMDSIAPFNKWERKMEELAKKGDKRVSKSMVICLNCMNNTTDTALNLGLKRNFSCCIWTYRY